MTRRSTSLVLVLLLVACKGDSTESAPQPPKPTPPVLAAPPGGADAAPAAVAAADAAASWPEQSGSGFVVRAPVAPTSSKLDADSAFGKLPSTVYVGYQGFPVAGTPGQMSVIASSLPVAASKLPRKALYDKLVTYFVRDVTPVATTAIELGDVDGVDVRYKNQPDPELGESAGHFRMFVRGRRLYRVAYDGLLEWKGAPATEATRDGERFIESFRLTAP